MFSVFAVAADIDKKMKFLIRYLASEIFNAKLQTVHSSHFFLLTKLTRACLVKNYKLKDDTELVIIFDVTLT